MDFFKQKNRSIFFGSFIWDITECCEIVWGRENVKKHPKVFVFSATYYSSIFARGHDKIIKPSLTPQKLPSVSESIRHEVDIYTNTTPRVIAKNECPFTWWDANKLRFPKLSQLALKFLSSPPSSVESERLFSVGGQIYTPLRNKLAAETGKILMFLNFNLKWLKGNRKS